MTLKGGPHYVETRKRFNRPLDMTVQMRQVSGSPECGVVAMFPTSKARHSGYNAGIGWWSNGFGTGAPSPQRAIIHVHKKDWQTVRIYAAADGNVYFFLNGGLEKVVKDTKYSSGPCLLYTSPSPRDGLLSRMPSSA